MLNIFKKLSIVLLAILLIFSFVACGKEDNTDNSSSIPSNAGPAQDYDDDWGENVTDDPAQSEATESLWNDGFSGGSAEIVGDDDDSLSSDADSSSQNSSSNNTSVESETTSSNDENSSDYSAEVGKDYNGIF